MKYRLYNLQRMPLPVSLSDGSSTSIPGKGAVVVEAALLGSADVVRKRKKGLLKMTAVREIPEDPPEVEDKAPKAEVKTSKTPKAKADKPKSKTDKTGKGSAKPPKETKAGSSEGLPAVAASATKASDSTKVSETTSVSKEPGSEKKKES